MTRCGWPHCPEEPHARALCRRHYLLARHSGRLRTTLADPEPVRGLITTHLDRGRTLHQLADTCALDPHAVRRIHDGQTTGVRVTTVAKLAAAPLPPTRVGVQRRMQALARAGHNRAAVAAAGGITVSRLRSALHRRQISAPVRLAIAAAYDHLADTRGQDWRVAAQAAKKNWPPPAAWDRHRIDDPTARACGIRRGWKAA